MPPSSLLVANSSATGSSRSSYRSLIAFVGARYLLTSFLGRLPAAMAPLGLIMLVVQVTGSYAGAGLATAALGVGAAAGGPIVGSLSDRLGQRVVGLWAALANAIALAATVFAVVSGVGTITIAALAAFVGLSTPQIGPLARVRWVSMLARQGRSLSTAMSYEGAVDETSYVAGPALVGLLALTGLAWLPLTVAAGLAAVASLAFALHRSAVGAVPTSSSRPASPMPIRKLAFLIAAMVGLGVVFGATQTGIAAFAASAGRPGAAGLIYAVLGVGSALAGFATVLLPARFAVAHRFPVAAGMLFLGSLALLLVHSTATAIAAMALLGVTAAPLLITVYTLAERIAPMGRIGAVMTWLASGTVGGVALGAAIAGSLAQAYGYGGAFVVPIVAGLLTFAVALLSFRRFIVRVPQQSAQRPTTLPVGASVARRLRPLGGSEGAIGETDRQPGRGGAGDNQDGRRRAEELQ